MFHRCFCKPYTFWRGRSVVVVLWGVWGLFVSFCYAISVALPTQGPGVGGKGAGAAVTATGGTMIVEKPTWLRHAGLQIFSVDTQPNGLRFATAGGDHKVSQFCLPTLLTYPCLLTLSILFFYTLISIAHSRSMWVTPCRRFWIERKSIMLAEFRRYV